ncbi:MAG: hypothetical protein ACSHXB_04995 [Sulfitobacter sp.]
MTITLAVIFVVCFIAGPLIFRTLVRGDANLQSMKMLGVFTVVFASAGLLFRFLLPNDWGQNLWVTVAGIVLIWLAWIGVLAFAAMALRRKVPSAKMRRWTTVFGALGTTVPWFGLASAMMMQG